MARQGQGAEAAATLTLAPPSTWTQTGSSDSVSHLEHRSLPWHQGRCCLPVPSVPCPCGQGSGKWARIPESWDTSYRGDTITYAIHLTRIPLHLRPSIPNEDIPPSWVTPPRKSQLTALRLPSKQGSGLHSTTPSTADRRPPSAQTMDSLWRKVRATQEEAWNCDLGPGSPGPQRRNQ